MPSPPHLPELWGGSADLAESNNTTPKASRRSLPPEHSTKLWTADWSAAVLHFGIREHAMGSVLNGIALHGGTRPYGGTFLVFSDYMRPAVRLAAVMKLPVTYVWTHDSIGLGEDGPTHQPIEHLAAPCGRFPVSTWSAPPTPTRPRRHGRRCWRTGPACRPRLTRQNVPTFPRGVDGFADTSGVARGAYSLLDIEVAPRMSSSSAPDRSSSSPSPPGRSWRPTDIPARVVSMPCREWFEEQDPAYRDQVLPPGVKARVSVEAGVSQGWREVVGDSGRIVSIEHFGASAQYTELFDKFGHGSSRGVGSRGQHQSRPSPSLPRRRRT